MKNITENEEEFEGYRSISVDSILIDQPLDFTLYICTHDKHGEANFIKYISQNSQMSLKQKERLIQNGIKNFYITHEDASDFENYLVTHLGEILDNGALNKNQKSEIIYSVSLNVMKDLFESEVSESKLFQAKSVMQETVKRIAKNEVTAVSMINLASHDYKSYSHSVNVAIYAAGLAYALDLDEEAITEIASGAILHDVGKSQIDPKIINKPATLTKEEYNIIKKHPDYSYDILIKNGETNQTILDIAKNHHEKLDGSGYNLGLSKNQISLATQIVTIADIFDALSTNRPYKSAASFFVVLNTMKNVMKEQLNMKILNSLIVMMGKE